MCKQSKFLLLIALLGCFILVGCSSNPTYILTPVEGIVLIDGKPARGIMVQFMPDVMASGQGPTSFAVSDESGKFTLKTYEGQLGAVVGPHNVILVDNEEERPEQGTVAKNRPRLAGRFTTASAQNIKIVVKESKDVVKIEASAN